MPTEIGFTSSMSLSEHPMKMAKPIIREKYFRALSYFAEQHELSQMQKSRLTEYRKMLVGDKLLPDMEVRSFITFIVQIRLRPWREKYRYWLISDLAMILLDKNLLSRTFDMVKGYFGEKSRIKLEQFFVALNNNQINIPSFVVSSMIMTQYRKNMDFLAMPLKRIIITGNMSAGKSTLINALIGKPLLRSAQEACTGTICYIYNKPFEDERIHFDGAELNLNADDATLHTFAWQNDIYIATYFRKLFPSERFSIIDTPGVNFALNTEHGSTTRNTLSLQQYDSLLYLFDSGNIGTESEFFHMKWVAKHIPHDRIIFVVNKLDNFRTGDDNIASSLQKLRDDLSSIGFENPAVYPVSAYFALLLKRKNAGEPLDEDDEDELIRLSKKFKKPAYDLSSYYEHSEIQDKDTELTILLKKCGIYGLEKQCL